MGLALGEGLHLDFGFVPADLGNGEDSVISVGQRADAFDEARDVGMRHIVLLELEIERAGTRFVRRWGGRIVAQLRVVHREIRRIDAETVDAAFEPETHYVEHRILHRGVVHVELRLRTEKIVQIVLAAACVPGPGGAAEDGLPVRRRRPIGLGIGPHVPVLLRVRPSHAAFGKPGVFVRSVRIDLVDQDLEAQFVRAGNERVEIGERSENRIDIAIVRHVVAEILHRRGKEGRYPDGIDPQTGDMREALRNARQIADPVAVRILEAARIDLVDRRPLPPRARGGGSGCSLDRIGAVHSAISATRHIAQPKAGRASGALPGAATAAGQSPASVSKLRAS